MTLNFFSSDGQEGIQVLPDEHHRGRDHGIAEDDAGEQEHRAIADAGQRGGQRVPA